MTDNSINKRKNNKEPLRSFRYFILWYVAISSLLMISVILYVFGKNELLNRAFCFEYSCISRFFSFFEMLVPLLDYLLKVLLSTVTIASLYYALNNYIKSTNAAEVNIHLTNLNTFKGYLLSESIEMKVSNVKKIDFLKWYNLIYPNSRDGDLTISTEYQNRIIEINSIIEKSNVCYQGKLGDNILFDYNQHQTKMINALKRIGFSLGRSPRNSFKESESLVFAIIDKVNKEFCGVNSTPLIIKQKYN